MSRSYQDLIGSLREAAVLGSVGNLLSWDQETMMPPRGADVRAEQAALIARLAHEKACSPQLGERIAACEADPALAADPPAAANLREIRRDYDRRCKLPADLVAEIGETSSRAVEAWKQARRDSEFAAFRPWLERQLELARRKAACYGTPPGAQPYDALLEDYEPGMTAARLERMFAPLRDALTELIAEIADAGLEPDGDLQRVRLDVDAQHRFNGWLLQRLGFDGDAGRLDVSTHPFCSGIAPGDTRLTTRYRETDFLDALGSTMHEAGHALYEQGLPHERHFGQPLGEAASLGIHESQSRLWENHVGRSLPFWAWAFPAAQRHFAPALEPFTVEQAYRAVNTVRPHLVRVESDEATYNLHVMLRFDLERAMLRGDLAVSDLPGAWNERMRQDLGLEVPDDARGCLQDIHWGLGAVGYFPTYTLGNLYGAQFWEALTAARPAAERQLEQGAFDPVLAWLREQIHAHGRRYSADELCRLVTGRPLGHEPLLRHLEGKLRPLYGV